jgi:thioredoxin reductase
VRKQIITQGPRGASTVEPDWLRLEHIARLEVTSEDAAHPVESALIPDSWPGWRAMDSGEQTIRLLFDAPQRIRRIRLLFREEERGRTQEFVLRWSQDGGRAYREVVRQQYTFSPPGTISEEEHFRVSTGGEKTVGQTFEARRLLLATGLRDLTPDCPGFRDFYGSSVFHCPDCNGFEVTGKRVAVLGSGKNTVGFTLGLLTWTDHLTLITGGERGDVTDEHQAKLAGADIPVINRAVVKLEGDAEAKRLERVLLDDGKPVECDALFFNLGTEPASGFHQSLGCRLEEEGGPVWVDEEHQTSVRGVYAAGDLTPRSQLAVVAAAEGAMAAVHIHKSLVPESRRV